MLLENKHYRYDVITKAYETSSNLTRRCITLCITRP